MDVGGGGLLPAARAHPRSEWSAAEAGRRSAPRRRRWHRRHESPWRQRNESARESSERCDPARADRSAVPAGSVCRTASAPKTWCMTDLIARHASGHRDLHARYRTSARADTCADARARGSLRRADPRLLPGCGGARSVYRARTARMLSSTASSCVKRAARCARWSRLRRALAGKRAWITGLRREQSPTRRRSR